MKKRIKIGRYERDSGIDFADSKSMTQQHFKEAADINNIVDKYKRTGTLTDPMQTSGRTPQFGDFTTSDYHTNANTIARIKSEFEHLPAKIRAHFKNNVEEMINFLAIAENKNEAIKMGLLPQEPEDHAKKTIENAKTIEKEIAKKTETPIT